MTNAGEQNYALAQQVAEQPLQQYQGQMVADVSPQTQQAWNVAANSGNVGADQYNGATAGYLGALSQTPASVTAGQISNTNLQPYMDPYTQDVINATMPIMQQQNALSQNQQANAANSANAFGGSRQGIQQGVAQAQGALNIGQMVAQLQNQNFTQAQAAATGDINRTMAAQQGNQTAEQAKINSDIAASQGLTNTGDSMNKANVANFNLLQSAGAGESMQQQNDINAQIAEFQQAFNYPQQQLGTLEASLGMTPHDTSTSGQTTSQSSTTTPTDWSSIIEKGASAASDFYSMSDKSMKTDVTKLGKDEDTGLPMYAYRYKGDPKSYPKVVGPMAQDVQKEDPGAVKRIGGKLAIRGYAAGTPFVSPSVAPFLPNASPGVAKGIGAMSAFRPPTRMPRGFGMPVMPKRFADGSAYVSNDDIDAGMADMGDSWGGGGGNIAGGLQGLAKTFAGGGAARAAAPSQQQQQAPRGWGAPSMPATPFLGRPCGAATVPGQGFGDSVPALLTPGEAVLTGPAADHLGRGNIAKLNAFLPPARSQATTMPRAGARGIKGALSNTKLTPKIAGALSG